MSILSGRAMLALGAHFPVHVLGLRFSMLNTQNTGTLSPWQANLRNGNNPRDVRFRTIVASARPVA